jgi:WD40 repeat protein
VVDQFNKPGSLVILDRIGQAHQVPLHNGSTGKTYDVNDVQFVPSCSRSLVSSGCDRKICWFKFGFVDEVVSGEDEAPSLAQVDKGETNRPITRSWSVDSANSEILFSRTLPCVPHELRFKPDAYDPVLAIACDDGKLRLHRNFDSDFKVWPIGRERAPAIVWGKGPTSDFLFGAAQRDSKNSAHKCLDPHSSRARVVYDLFEDNDNIALHPHGATLAAMTLADSLNKMHLLDVAREIRQPILSINLEPFLTTHRFANGDSAQDEIKSAEYSPDGIYLALGRTDDTVHVYDSRMMHRGPVHQFSQSFSRKSAGQQNGGEVLGVAKLQWIEGEKSRYGLVSSGTDARVRLWDVLRSSDDSLNGHILAEANFDVNTFNIGTRPGQDYTMILGDCGGTLCAYDKW